MSTAICWLRRNLRLNDNDVLATALARHDQIVPAFVVDPRQVLAPEAGQHALSFLFGAVASLDADLRARGAHLVVRAGDPVAELARLAVECQAERIYAQDDVSPFARGRDAAVAARLPLTLLPGLTVHPPTAVAKSDGSPYTVFTSYSRAWSRLPAPARGDLHAAPRRLPVPAGLVSTPLPDSGRPPEPDDFPPTEAVGRRLLRDFARGAGIAGYADGRDRLDRAGTSRLSRYLRFGLVSAREAVVAARERRDAADSPDAARGAATWLNELVWREFYWSVLHHYPFVLQSEFRADLRGIEWRDDPAGFAAWRDGETGYPVVDAAMRELASTGWLHNRARLIVASFLVKDLLIDWRLGERYFRLQLIDGDPAANNGNWQWTAGVGTDAAPYFRVLNPVLQGRKFDPEGDYVRRWVPELARVPTTAIHEPWEMSGEAQRAASRLIGRDYPAPIVDHGASRDRALAAYAAARERNRRFS